MRQNGLNLHPSIWFFHGLVVGLVVDDLIVIDSVPLQVELAAQEDDRNENPAWRQLHHLTDHHVLGEIRSRFAERFDFGGRTPEDRV